MEIDGVNYSDEAPYVESDWEFEITNGNNGKSGFDAVKLGDIDGEEELTGPPVYFTILNEIQGDTLKKSYMVEDFDDIESYYLEVDFDEENYSYFGLNEKDLNGVEDYFFGLTDTTKGMIYTIWYDEVSASPVSLQDSMKIFELLFLDNSSWRSSSYENDLSYVGISGYAIDKWGRTRPVDFKIDQEQIISSLHVAPNPFSNSFNLVVESNIASKAEIFIHNALGQLLFQTDLDFHPGNNNIPLGGLSKLPNGMLILTVQSGGKQVSTKLIKQN